ncbi:FliM/FliN family flagellar motor switch protein [Sagittula sp. M10.9X]|uniref:FliM/FliN family flagellar motor switch protein n=2 Tax=Sagittula salina TaxID=2820268 RepID=A0A940MRQ9_9RHOB|nr:FliM/FliN family flagellar motor switch protein [Sagittula salina]
MSPAKALRRSLSKTADLLWGLALVTQNVSSEGLDQDGVVEGLVPSDLLILLDGPEGEVGLASVDRQVLTGVIEVQTILQVTQMPVEEDRPLTQTDAAMVAPLLDGALTRMAAALADSPVGQMLEGYRFGAMLEDARSASLLLDAASYRVFRADVDLALGRRKGRLSFILPEKKPNRGPSVASGEGAPGPHAEVLGRVSARLDAVLSRIRLPLSKAQALKPGDTLRLSADALDRVEIHAGAGRLVAKGRMGQMNGYRAVRLTWPVLGPLGISAPPPAAAEGGGEDFGGGFGGDAPALPGGGMEEDFPAAGDGMAEDFPDLDFGTEGGDFGGDFNAEAGDFSAEAGDFDAGSFNTDDAPAEDFEMDFGNAPMEIDFKD